MVLDQTSLSLIFLISIFSVFYLKLTEHELFWQKLDHRKTPVLVAFQKKKKNLSSRKTYFHCHLPLCSVFQWVHLEHNFKKREPQ